MNTALKRFLSFTLAVFCLLAVAGCKDKKEPLTFLDYSKAKYAFDQDLNGVICENDAWRLLWDDEYKRVSFLDKRTNMTWGQTPDEILSKQKSTGIVLPQLNSAVVVVYQDPVSMNEIYLYSYSDAFETGEITAKKIENGIRVIYNFTQFQFAVPVEYTIGEETFDIKITPAHIAQGDKYKVTAVKVAPFMCSVQNDAKDSWLFLPDGSGALVEPFTSDTLGIFGESEVYGHDLATQLYGYSNKTNQVHMPVYGVKKGGNALLAVIDSSAPSASVSWELGSDTYGCSTAYATFRLRGTNRISRPGNFISVTTLPEIDIFTDGILKTDIRIKYYSLAGEDASIMGMAETYRNYLVKNRNLTKSKNSEKDAMFKCVGGTVQSDFVAGVPTQKLFALTHTSAVSEMIKELTDRIGNNISVNLVGYGESGIDVGKLAGGFTVASPLGGNTGMKKLHQALKDLGVSSYMDFDLITFDKSGNGFDQNSCAVYEGGEPVTYTGFDSVTHIRTDDRFYVLSRDNLFEAADMLPGKVKELGSPGISLASLSHTSYSDYAKQEYYACGKTEEDITKIFRSLSKSGKLLSSSANVYAAISSDEVTDAPIYSSGYLFESYDVPFYQMVLKGYIPMSSVSLNLCADRQDALLRCVSSGIAPSYTLIKDYDNSLITSSHAFLPSSVYGSNKDSIFKETEQISPVLKSVQNATITGFTVLKKDLTKTDFDNGVWTVVNFSDSAQECEYGTVPAKSFISGRDAA